jgi:hypothetical protein
MCPACISSMALAVAGVTSTGAVSTFVARGFARIARGGKTQQPESEEVIHHDHKPDAAPEDRLAS